MWALRNECLSIVWALRYACLSIVWALRYTCLSIVWALRNMYVCIVFVSTSLSPSSFLSLSWSIFQAPRSFSYHSNCLLISLSVHFRLPLCVCLPGSPVLLLPAPRGRRQVRGRDVEHRGGRLLRRGSL